MKDRLADIAEKLDTHLRRLEFDSEWNIVPGGRRRLWNTGACSSGNRIFCTYVAYQGGCSLTKKQALAYLAKLNAGFKGRHFEALRDEAAV